MVEELNKKVDSISSAPAQMSCVTPLPTVNATAKTPIWPRIGAKRRRGDYGQTIRPAVNKGTKEMSFEDLSVLSILPTAPTPIFWLYLSGFQPKITDNDVEKIVSRCLETDDPVNVIRLVPKGKDVSNMTFVSFKIGLPPTLKSLALNSESWHDGLMFREFIDQPKNATRSPYTATRERHQDSPAPII